MGSVMLVEFEDGKSLVIGGDDRRSGLDDVSLVSDATKATGEQLKKAFMALPGLLNAVEEGISACMKKPNEIECEFSISITADCKLWVVSAESEGEFKVKLKWK